jgi:uncharacterized protein YjbI with pentapeptide repeats
MNTLIFKKIMKRNKLALIGILVVLGVVILAAIVDIPFYMDKFSRESPFLRKNFIRIAKIAIPLKDLILSKTESDKLARLKSTGACSFCDLTKTNMEGMDLIGVDLRYANLQRSNLKGANLIGANLKGTNLERANLNGANLTGARLIETNLSGVDLGGKDRSGTIIHQVNLSGVDLSGVDLSGKDLTGANLSGVDLSGKDLSGTILAQANLKGTNLSGVDLSGKDLSGSILVQANFSGANLSGVDLSGKDFSGANLSGVDLSGKDLTGANLSGVDLSGKDLTGTTLIQANLSGTNLSGVDLTGANLKGAKQIGIHIKKPRDLSISYVTSFDLSGNVQYLTTKNGLLYELKNEESTIVLNLVDDARWCAFHAETGEGGLLSVVSNNKFVYISYTCEDSLVVDEYSKDFSNVRNIIKIPVKGVSHFGGTLVFDKHKSLYLSVGDDENHDLPQNLKSLRGKILRLDVSKLKKDPVIVAYGLRNPWKVSIDSKNRMFIGDVGSSTVESVYLLNDLYSDIPYNLGWPVFEGTNRFKEGSLMFKDTLAPIYEYKRLPEDPGSVIGGFYLDHLEVYLSGDVFGTLWLLKEEKNGKWNLFHYEKPVNLIWTFGYDEKTQKIFIGPNNFELIISIEPVKLNAQVNLCGTTMPNGSINNSVCQ